MRNVQKEVLNFTGRLAQYVLYEESSEELPAIASQGLKEGFETPSLVVLAGFNEYDNPFVIAAYFTQLLKELNLNLSDKEYAALYLLGLMVDKIIHGEVDVYNGCDFIFSDVLGLTDLRRKDNMYVYDSIGFANIYGLYDTIGELVHASERWDSVRSNEQLIEDTKKDIKKKLEEWRLKNDDPLKLAERE